MAPTLATLPTGSPAIDVLPETNKGTISVMVQGLQQLWSMHLLLLMCCQSVQSTPEIAAPGL
jgi:hypothetical protein